MTASEYLAMPRMMADRALGFSAHSSFVALVGIPCSGTHTFFHSSCASDDGFEVNLPDRMNPYEPKERKVIACIDRFLLAQRGSGEGGLP
jgi:hypothetical protein